MSGIRATIASAITDDKGAVDVGYLMVLWVGFSVLGAITGGMLLAAANWYVGVTAPCAVQPPALPGMLRDLVMCKTRTLDLVGMGTFVGACAGGFGVALGALGAFRAGDKPRAA